MRRRSAIFLLGIALPLSGCGEEETDGEPARTVVVERVAVHDAVDRLELLGEINGEVEVRVFAQMPERIRELHVEEGQRVAEGDPIATLEADIPTADLAQAGAALTAAEASRDRLSSEVDRVERLVAGQAAAPSQLDSLRSQLAAAEAQVAQSSAARRAAGERRARTVVRAPADGQVALLTVAAGDTVAPSVPICSIVQMDRVEVVVRAVEPDFVRLREGMAVTIAPPSLPDVTRTGAITRISPILDRLTRTAPVEIDVDNPDHTLRPGMVAEVEIEIERRPDVMMVPARAVLMTSQTDTERLAHVFVVEDDHAVRREVRIGRRYDELMEIVDGVEVGDPVVVQGQHLLRDGTEVRVREDEAPALAEAT